MTTLGLETAHHHGFHYIGMGRELRLAWRDEAGQVSGLISCGCTMTKAVKGGRSGQVYTSLA